MIKKILAFFLAFTLLIIKKIFIRDHPVPHKIMDPFSNKLHSLFIYTSLIGMYAAMIEIEVFDYSLDSIIYLVLFLQFVLIIRYFNQRMLEEKEQQIKLVKNISRFSFVLFIANWIFFTFGFAVAFILMTLVNYAFYVFINNQIKRAKEQEEFKKQFGQEAQNYSKADIVKTHISNLFEEEKDINSITKSDIKKQYRKMAKKYHPDVCQEEDKDKFASINTSYNYLLELVESK
jgi:flagellar biosynthesis/type III secretory pathway M-ring protein FliF/YscJ